MKNYQLKFQTETLIDIQELLKSPQNVEKILSESVKKFKSDLLQATFEKLEECLVSKKTICLKDRRPKTFYTVLGEIHYPRYRAFDRKLNKMCYPLDLCLGLSDSEKICPGLKDELLQLAVDVPYRFVAKQIKHWTHNSLSKDLIWSFIQNVGQQRWQEKNSQRRFNRHEALPLSHEIIGQQPPSEILCIGMDGTYVKRQEKKKKLKTKHDVKVAVLYTGKIKKAGDTHLHNRQTVIQARDESLDLFLGRVVEKAISHYGLNQKTTVLLFGDGDAWIRRFKDFIPQAHYRLDPWHVMEKIKMALGIEVLPKEWVKLIYGNPDGLIAQITQLAHALADDPFTSHQKITDLISYIQNNREGLLPWNVAQDIKQRHRGLFKWGSGHVESQIELAVYDRHKLHRMSWSKRGLQNLSTLREDKLNNHAKPKFKCTKPPKPFRINLGSLGVLPIYPQ